MSAPRIIRLRPEDDVVIAAEPIEAGVEIAEEGIVTRDQVPPGHKIAVRDLSKGAKVRRYNQVIGAANVDIPAGSHVHVHNLVMTEIEHDYAIGADAKPADMVSEPATFMGIRAPMGALRPATTSASSPV